ncbi:MAG: molybdate ABC transporter substrate-binding protein, partial [Planctomycetota bacterium]
MADLLLATQNIEAKVQPASSSVLANQILNGAPAGLFISAHPQWMDELDKAGKLIPDSRQPLAGNDIVLVAGSDQLEPFTLIQDTLLADKFTGRIAIGDPEHVPAGRYAREALQALGLWEQIEDRLAPALDARAALLAV